MSLQEFPLTIPDNLPLRSDVLQFIRTATDRVDNYYYSKEGQKLKGFVPCDFDAVQDLLHALSRDKRCRGKRFLEWGCGFGVVAGLARFHGFESAGIEFVPRLVREARALMRDFDLPVKIAEGNLIPAWLYPVRNSSDDSYEVHEEYPEPHPMAPEDAGPAYEFLDWVPSEVDVFFVYPWPDEIQMMCEIFDRVADYGALLILFQGVEELQIFQRV